MTVPSENKSYFRVLYSPDGSHVACGMSRAEVRILDSTTGAQVGRILHWPPRREKEVQKQLGNVGNNLKQGYSSAITISLRR